MTIGSSTPTRALRTLLADLKSEQSRLQTEKDAIAKDTPLTFVMADLPKPRKSFVMKRGAYDQPGEPVSRNVPSFLPGLPQLDEKRDYNRLDFANWLLSPEHPLTARVAVNRFWQQFFGTGLVRTSGDFGSQGEPPSHPELLDWLASEFVQSGWDVRRLVKLIVTSHTYQQSSRHTPPLLAKDPDNRLLGRAPRLRLDAEVLRDQALFVSGMLVGKIGGKPVKTLSATQYLGARWIRKQQYTLLQAGFRRCSLSAQPVHVFKTNGTSSIHGFL